MRFNQVLLVSVFYPKSAYTKADVPEAGLAYIAEALHHNDIGCCVLDMNLGRGFKDIERKIRESKPKLVGLGIKSFQYRNSYKLINDIKNKFPGVKIVVGGPHVSVGREKVLEECNSIDFGITREGDESIIELCKGKALHEIKGLIFRDCEKVVYTGDRELINDLDRVPFPKYEDFELDKYWYPGRYIVSSRGCPNNCTFCAVKLVTGRKWRARSAKNVVDELRYWYEQGYRRFEFIDDNFTLSKSRVLEFCDLVEKFDLKDVIFYCPNGIRADRVDRELLKRMKEVGWDSVLFGVEGGNDKILKLIKKGESMETIERAIGDALDLGFNVDLNFIIGFPGETISDVEDSFKLALKYPIRHVNFSNLIPYHGTELHSVAEEHNYLIKPPEVYLNEITTKVREPILETPELSLEERRFLLRKSMAIQREVHKRYHIRRLKKEYGSIGRIVGGLYHYNIMPMWVFNKLISLKKLFKRKVH